MAAYVAIDTDFGRDDHKWRSARAWRPEFWLPVFCLAWRIPPLRLPRIVCCWTRCSGIPCPTEAILRDDGRKRDAKSRDDAIKRDVTSADARRNDATSSDALKKGDSYAVRNRQLFTLFPGRIACVACRLAFGLKRGFARRGLFPFTSELGGGRRGSFLLAPL